MPNTDVLEPELRDAAETKRPIRLRTYPSAAIEDAKAWLSGDASWRGRPIDRLACMAQLPTCPRCVTPGQVVFGWWAILGSNQ